MLRTLVILHHQGYQPTTCSVQQLDKEQSHGLDDGRIPAKMPQFPHDFLVFTTPGHGSPKMQTSCTMSSSYYWHLETSSCQNHVMIYWFASKNLQIFKILWKNVNPHAGGTYKSLSLQGASCSCQLPVYCRSSTGQYRWDNFSAFAQLRPNETSFNRCMAAKLAVRKAWVTLMTLG